ncbi:hypothetical protein PHYBOEH_010804 [Phytophthora boehmeriae]|uniref:RxLR effector protein n=1 Tax=Phytophthora boehmeriae TaxID=109152 RepID=A0A8T1VNF2_9STRA|nr:hypothetical protein PHYBOEH_010804 [Phytophthora boehmeriae]
MRPYYVLLLSLALLFAFSNAVLAETPGAADSLTLAGNSDNNKRSLRVATATEDADSGEERFLGFNSVSHQLKKMRRTENKATAASEKLKNAEAAKADKIAMAVKKATEKAEKAQAAKIAKLQKEANAKAAKLAKVRENENKLLERLKVQLPSISEVDKILKGASSEFRAKYLAAFQAAAAKLT